MVALPASTQTDITHTKLKEWQLYLHQHKHIYIYQTEGMVALPASTQTHITHTKLKEWQLYLHQHTQILHIPNWRDGSFTCINTNRLYTPNWRDGSFTCINTNTYYIYQTEGMAALPVSTQTDYTHQTEGMAALPVSTQTDYTHTKLKGWQLYLHQHKPNWLHIPNWRNGSFNCINTNTYQTEGMTALPVSTQTHITHTKLKEWQLYLYQHKHILHIPNWRNGSFTCINTNTYYTHQTEGMAALPVSTQTHTTHTKLKEWQLYLYQHKHILHIPNWRNGSFTCINTNTYYTHQTEGMAALPVSTQTHITHTKLKEWQLYLHQHKHILHIPNWRNGSFTCINTNTLHTPNWRNGSFTCINTNTYYTYQTEGMAALPASTQTHITHTKLKEWQLYLYQHKHILHISNWRNGSFTCINTNTYYTYRGTDFPRSRNRGQNRGRNRGKAYLKLNSQFSAKTLLIT